MRSGTERGTSSICCRRRNGKNEPARLRRYEAFCTMALEASAAHRRISREEFHRLFPTSEAADLQLVLLPLVLDRADEVGGDTRDLAPLRALLRRAPRFQQARTAPAVN